MNNADSRTRTDAAAAVTDEERRESCCQEQDRIGGEAASGRNVRAKDSERAIDALSRSPAAAAAAAAAAAEKE